jgi:hypothetical protein
MAEMSVMGNLSGPSEEDDYGVDTLSNGDVRVRLGPVMPFEVPAEAAIRLAALLCQKAGCEIMFRSGSMKIKFPSGFEFGDESLAERSH